MDIIKAECCYENFEFDFHVSRKNNVTGVCYSSYHNVITIQSPKRLIVQLNKQTLDGTTITKAFSEMRKSEENYTYSISLSDPENLNEIYDLGLHERSNIPRDIENILLNGNETLKDYENYNSKYLSFNAITKRIENRMQSCLSIKNTFYHRIFQKVSTIYPDIKLDDDDEITLPDFTHCVHLYKQMQNLVSVEDFYKKYRMCLFQMSFKYITLIIKIKDNDDDDETIDIKIILSQDIRYPNSLSITNVHSNNEMTKINCDTLES